MTGKERDKHIELWIVRRALMRVVDDPRTPSAIVWEALAKIEEIDAELEAAR